MILRELYYISRVMTQDNICKEKMKSLRISFLNDVIISAYDFPHYRRYLDSSGLMKHTGNQDRCQDDDNMHIPGIRSISDIKRIPISSKKDIVRCIDDKNKENRHGRKRRKKDIADRYSRKTYSISSSNTSGNSIEISLDDEGLDYISCIFNRSLIRQGYEPFRKIGFYWYRKEKNGTLSGISRKVLLDSSMTPEEIIGTIRKNRLEFIYIFPFKLLELCLSFRKEELRELRIKKIFCIGEVLTPGMISLFEDRIGCEISDNYGSSEFNIIAFRKHGSGSYRINEDSVIVELEDVKQEELGLKNKKKAKSIKRAIITSLVNNITPLIRYDTGDLVQTDSSGEIVRILGRKEYFINGVYIGDIIDILLDHSHIFRKFNIEIIYEKVKAEDNKEKNRPVKIRTGDVNRRIKKIIINIDPSEFVRIAHHGEIADKIMIERRMMDELGINAELKICSDKIFFFRTGKINLIYDPKKSP